MLPFAHNESTRFISPTKTPEYLAAGKPVVSTSITDVVRPYGTQRLVRIADTHEEWIKAIDGVMTEEARDPKWRARVDAFLAQNSWDITWMKMRDLIEDRIAMRRLGTPKRASLVVSSMQTAVVGDYGGERL
jgi:UDP-galactopyranose mutase